MWLCSRVVNVRITDNSLPEEARRWSSIANFNEYKETLQANVVAFAKKAWREMMDVCLPRLGASMERSCPKAMSALAVDQTLYFSSSVRGGSFMYEFKSPEVGGQVAQEVKRALQRCMLEVKSDDPDRKTSHRAQANCAEPFKMSAVVC